nr:hypothetical protein [Tanacetum cinerariifolium]
NSGNSYVYDPNPISFDCPPDSYHPPHPTDETCSYDSYGNNSQFGYNYQPQFPLNYESEPCYNENYNSYPYDSSSLPQQYLCCARCGGPYETCQCDQLIFDVPYCKHCGRSHMNYQCQPMNQDSNNSNSLGFDQPQPPQSPVIHQPPQELSIHEMEDLKQQYLDELKRLSNLEYCDEETNTFDNSLPEFETFCFDVEENSSGSTTTHPDISLPKYEVFHDDHVKEISSGSPTTPSDSSLYASFMFDLLINPFPHADRSDFYEFTDELIPFISAPEYDCFLFKVEPNSRDFTKDVVENISPTKEPQVLNTLPPPEYEVPAF